MKLHSVLPLAALAAACPFANAQDFEMPRVGVHVASKHLPERRPNGKAYNNDNPGLYLRWDNGITVGTYENSYGRRSNYLAWSWTSEKCGPALTMGLVTGYLKNKPAPMLAPSICFADHIRIAGFPGRNAAVVHLSIEFGG